MPTVPAHTRGSISRLKICAAMWTRNSFELISFWHFGHFRLFGSPIEETPPSASAISQDTGLSLTSQYGKAPVNEIFGKSAVRSLNSSQIRSPIVRNAGTEIDHASFPCDVTWSGSTRPMRSPGAVTMAPTILPGMVTTQPSPEPDAVGLVACTCNATMKSSESAYHAMTSVDLFGSKRGEMETTRASVIAIWPGTCTRRMAGSFLCSRGPSAVSVSASAVLDPEAPESLRFGPIM